MSDEKAFVAYVVKFRFPIVERRNVRHQPFSFAQLRIVRHENSAHRNVRIEQLEFCDLFAWIIPAIEKDKIDRDRLAKLRQPSWNYLL